MTRKGLIEAFGPEVGARCDDLIRGKIDVTEHPAVLAWVAGCHHDPRRNPNARAEVMLCALDAELEGYGVEAIEGRYVDRYNQNIQAIYSNQGDTYTTTILYDNERGKYLITSWGDWIERHGRRREVA
jgi:hypothetical protein